jgi:hypothetical protein
MGKMREMVHEMSVAVFSDGCGMNPSFVIVLTTPLRWSPGFPGNRSHSLEPSANRSHSFVNRSHSLVLKVTLLSCSVSECEHRSSIEDWIRTHTNLKLKQFLEMYETGLIPWDIEMTVRLKSLCQTTRTGSPTVSPTSSPSLNPKKTLTKF